MYCVSEALYLCRRISLLEFEPIRMNVENIEETKSIAHFYVGIEIGCIEMMRYSNISSEILPKRYGGNFQDIIRLA